MERRPWSLWVFSMLLTVAILSLGVSNALAGGYPLFLRMAGVRQSQLEEGASDRDCSGATAAAHTIRLGEPEPSERPWLEPTSRPSPRTAESTARPSDNGGRDSPDRAESCGNRGHDE